MRLSRFSSGLSTAISIGLAILMPTYQTVAQRALGTDVSNYQGGNINWAALKTDGITFAWAKATQSTSFIDADFVINENNAKAAGVPIGAYDFAEPHTNTPAAEAAYFWAEAGPYIKADGLTVMPMLDYETFSGAIQGASSYSDWANQWCQWVQAAAASNGVYVKPVIYVGPCNDESYLNSSVSGWLNNIAVYPGSPNAQTGNPWSSSTCTSDPAWGGAWTVWQYYDTNWSGGDSDVFNGTVSQMQATLIATSTAAQAPTGSTVFWDPGHSHASPGSGGSGTWDTATANWWYSGSSNVAWSAGGANAVFAGTPGTVTMDLNLTAGSITFETNAYVVNGGNTLTLESPALISVAPPGTGPIYLNPLLSSALGCSVVGGGVLVLSNPSNSITGNLAIGSNTTVVINSSACSGLSSGFVYLTNGILQNNSQKGNGNLFLNSSTGIVLQSGSCSLNDNTSATLSYSGVISGSGSLVKTGSGGTLTLNGTNTYSGNTTVSAGTLALGATGSINNTPQVTIDAGGTFDVSAISGWNLNYLLVASGTGSTVGSTAATIVGSGSTSPNFNSQPITLIFSPSATNGDTSHPALYVSAGTLVLSHGNTLTISNTLGQSLGAGQYLLIQTAGGISGAPYPTAAFQGKGIASGNTGSLVVSNNNLYLSVTPNSVATTTTLNSLTASTYGQSVTFTATVSPSPSGGTVQFKTNGVAIGSPATVSGGSASYSTSALAVGSYSITASYSGTTGYSASSTSSASTQQVNAATLDITADAQSKVYGTVLNFGPGSTNFMSSGLENGDTVGSVTLAVSGNGGASNAPVGTYVITPSAATGGTFSSNNYSIVYITNALTVTLPPNSIQVTITCIMLLTNGNVEMNFNGTPGYVYYIESTTNLTQPINWSIIGTNAADTNGNFSFTDTNASNFSTQYYQTAAEP